MLSDDHDSERASAAASAAAESPVAPETSDVTEEHRLTEEQPSPLSESAIGSGRLAQQRTPKLLRKCQFIRLPKAANLMLINCS